MMSGKCQDICHLLLTNHSTFKFTFKAQCKGTLTVSLGRRAIWCYSGKHIQHPAPAGSSSSLHLLLAWSSASFNLCSAIMSSTRVMYSRVIITPKNCQANKQNCYLFSPLVLPRHPIALQRTARTHDFCPTLTLHHEHYAKPKEVMMLSKSCWVLPISPTIRRDSWVGRTLLQSVVQDSLPAQ